MTKRKQRFYIKWRTVALSVGFLTNILLITSVLAQDSGYIYWAEQSKIGRANLDGTDVKNLNIPGINKGMGIALDVPNGHIYWVERGSSKIRRANLDGTAAQDHITGVNEGREIALDLTNNNIYWMQRLVGGMIRRANLDGSNPVNHATPAVSLGWALTLDLTNNHIYWSSSTKIHRANLNGTSPVDLIPQSMVLSIRLDVPNDHIYWATLLSIGRADLDGNNAEDLVTGINGNMGMALDLTNKQIYWSESVTSKIRRANLDGTGAEDLITGVTSGVGIALQIAAPRPSGSQEIRYIPFRSKYLLVALVAALGAWLVMRRR